MTLTSWNFAESAGSMELNSRLQPDTLRPSQALHPCAPAVFLFSHARTSRRVSLDSLYALHGRRLTPPDKRNQTLVNSRLFYILPAKKWSSSCSSKTHHKRLKSTLNDSAACSAVNRVRLTTLTVQRGFLSMQSIETRSGCSCIAVHVRGPRHLSPRCSLAVYCTTCDRPLSRPQAKAASSSGSRP